MFDTYAASLRLIARVYENSAEAGNLHVVLDDLNLDDVHLDRALKLDLTEAERACAADLREYQEDARYIVIDLYELASAATDAQWLQLRSAARGES